jgi:hypothetical protein
VHKVEGDDEADTDTQTVEYFSSRDDAIEYMVENHDQLLKDADDYFADCQGASRGMYGDKTHHPAILSEDIIELIKQRSKNESTNKQETI